MIQRVTSLIPTIQVLHRPQGKLVYVCTCCNGQGSGYTHYSCAHLYMAFCTITRILLPTDKITYMWIITKSSTKSIVCKCCHSHQDTIYLGSSLEIGRGTGSRGGGWPSTKWVVTFWAASRGGEVDGGSERSLKEGGCCCQAGLLRFCTQRTVEHVRIE